MEEDSFMASRDKNRDKEKRATDLLRRSLAAPAGASGSGIGACPDPEILAGYAERSLDADEASRWNLHFSQCARCREQLAALIRSVPPTGTAAEKPSRAPGRSWTADWDWRWIAPATAMVLFVAVVALFRPPHKPAEQSSSPLVAMNQPAASPAASTPTNVTAGPESAPAADASAPNSPSAANSVARISPNMSAAKSEVAPPPMPRALDDKKQTLALKNLPLSNRNYTELDKVAKPAAAPTADASLQAGNASTPVGASESVTVTAAATPVMSPARTAAAPVPPDISNSTAAGAITPAPATALKSARTQHMSSAVATGRSFAQTESVVVEAGDATSPRTAVRTPDPQVLWRISSGRFVERSSDAGATWRVQWTSPNAHLVGGAAPTADTCWLVGRDAMILLTTDGRKWSTITPPTDADFVSVAATDASSATVTTTDGRKFETSDGGKHWTHAP
jgi:hypothetical protein